MAVAIVTRATTRSPPTTLLSVLLKIPATVLACSFISLLRRILLLDRVPQCSRESAEVDLDPSPFVLREERRPPTVVEPFERLSGGLQIESCDEGEVLQTGVPLQVGPLVVDRGEEHRKVL